MAITQKSFKNKFKTRVVNTDNENRIVEDIASIIQEIETIESNLPESLTYTEVAISSAQILDLGNTPIELLPNADANKYYEIQKFILEFTELTTPYTFNDAINIYGINSYAYLTESILTSGTSNVTVINNYGSDIATYVDTLNVVNRQGLGGGIQISTYNGTNPTLGDGTILVKIWYRVRTFGTEL